MKQNFTKFTFLFVAFLLSNSLYGQWPYIMQVDGIDNEIVNLSAAFGPCVQGENVIGEMVQANPLIGCEALTNAADISGKIAVIDRGTCDFVEKARNAQTAGAIAVIICNNSPASDPDRGGLIQMGLGDGQMDDITIPTYSVTLEDCISFQTRLPAMVTITPPPFDLTSDDKVLWGNESGQGDFNGGLNGWSSVTLECNSAPSEVPVWTWEEDGRAQGSGSTGSAPGPSFCNGAMAFNSDFLDNNGELFDDFGNLVEANLGIGDCPAPQFAELISPIIDISGSDVAGVSVEFFQDYREFNTRYFVEYSLDGGINYTPIEINEEADPDTNNGFVEANNVKMSIPLPGAAGADLLRIKFTAFANYYYWMIDDVKIVEREANNIRVNENFFAAAPNVKVPKSQVDAINFLADIQNIGANTQENTTLSISVTDDASGEEVFSDAVNLGSITPDSLTENNLFPNTFTPPAVVASYTGVYTVSSDSEDVDLSDNSRTINFEVTDDEFANENGEGLGGITITDPSQTPTWAIGNYFYVPNGDGYKISKVDIGIGNADQVGGFDVGVRIFKWTDVDADSDGSGFPEAAPDERDLIGFATYEILGNELATDPNPVDVDDPDDPILLEDEGHYLVMMTMDAEVGVSAKDDLYNSYLAMNLASTDAGNPRYWSFFGNSSDIGETVYDANTSFTPLVRMTIAPLSSVATTELPTDNIVSISPNPAKEFINLKMDFTKSFEAVDVTISDIAGRVVLMQHLEDVQSHQMQVDVSNLMSGTFMVNISTPEGIRTEKFIKVD